MATVRVSKLRNPKLRDTAAVVAGVSSVVLTGAAASVVLSALGSSIAPDGLLRALTPPLLREDVSAPVIATETPNYVAHRDAAPVLVTAPSRTDYTTVPDASSTAPNYSATVTVDDYYVAANIAAPEPAQVDLAVTTNAFDIVPEFVRRLYDLDPAANGPTTLRTEHDFKAGTLTITASDPEIGTYSITFDGTVV